MKDREQTIELKEESLEVPFEEEINSENLCNNCGEVMSGEECVPCENIVECPGMVEFEGCEKCRQLDCECSSETLFEEELDDGLNCELVEEEEHEI